MTASDRYRQLRARGLCVNCGQTKALALRAYCEACQRRRDDRRRVREGWLGGVRTADPAPPPVPPRQEPTPRERRFVTLTPPYERQPVTFEIVWP